MSNSLTVMTAALALAVAACSPTETVVQDDFGFDGTCTRCHAGLSAGQVHPTFKLRCVDCHGGNDQVSVPENAAKDPSIFRDPTLIAQAHVKPRPELARFFWANGIDDDGDGVVDEGPVIQNIGGVDTVTDFGEIAEPGLQGEGMGEFLDTELNRDLNYTRWLNPGDLRVATIGCGSRARAALDGSAGGGCHQDVVDSMRRSMMVNQSAVVNGAYYGNESWRAAFQSARDDGGPVRDQRAGAFGYVLDYDDIDSCIDTAPVNDEKGGRAQPVFNSNCLQALAAAADANAAAAAPGNAGLPAFEAVQGKITGSAPGTQAGFTLAHGGAKNPRIKGWGGKPLMDPTAVLADLQAMPNQDLEPGVPDPVDLVLRGFRAYYPMNYPGSEENFNFTFGTSIEPEIGTIKTADPFGRGHGSGCSSCHMRFNNDGARDPQLVSHVEDGKLVTEEVRDPTTVHREFDPDTQDIIDVGGEQHLVGMSVKQAERDVTGREQQRYYSADHHLTARVTTDQCGLCHGFVTRINMAYQGMAEDEQRDKLARAKPIAWTTFDGTPVTVHDSWVREEKGGDGNFHLVIPDGVDVVELAKQRDAQLAQQGLIPGAGGCAPNTFTEDCNNNGELDHGLVLTRVDEKGNTVATATIDEDLNRNGVLDLIDHVPREKSVDGRQLRYVYGGTNGSTRLMDIHFEKGMHCIDCHMLQDAHGDGNIYSTNWDTIEIECEDCHGAQDRPTLFTSGANGGNDLTRPVDQDGRPFFERVGNKIIERSRVTPGVFWEVPQMADVSASDPLAAVAHSADHLPQQAPPGGHNTGSTFAGDPGHSALQKGTLECYTCHTSWVLNCMGCHMNVNLGDKIKNKVLPDGTIVKVAGENEIWFDNSNQAGATNFQLLDLMRSPFVLGTDASADGGRLAPFRSSMELHVSVSDTNGDTLVDNATFTTFQQIDGNSGRGNVATSGVAMNMTMPHTVRPRETRGCETCHALVDQQGRVRNENILAETYGIGAGRYPYVGDWAIVAGTGGLELYDYKQEREIAGNTAGASTRFPGIIVNPADRVPAAVEPLLDGSGGVDGTFAGTDVALVRNFAAAPASAGAAPPAPTLRDLAIETVSDGNSGFLVITDVGLRGHPSAARPSVGNGNKVFTLALPGAGRALTRMPPDVSDPFVYVADGTAGLTVIEVTGAPQSGTPAAHVVTTAALPSGRDATEVALAGDVAYVGTAQGTVEVFDLSDPRAPAHATSVTLSGEVRGLAVGGFDLYAATSTGLSVLSIIDPLNPAIPTGAPSAEVLTGFAGQELYYYGGRLFVAAGADGVLDIDATTPAAPINNGNLVDEIAPGEAVDAQDVEVSQLAGQTWVLAADANGDLVGLKLDRTQSTRERCLPDPIDAGCGLDMDWRDPTIMGRDPAFDPNAGTFDAGDPSGPPFFRQSSAILSAGRRMARPALWEQIGTQTGRRLRDSFMPGSGVLSLGVMQTMHEQVQLCENQDFIDLNGSGLGPLGPADDTFFATGECTPYGVEARAAKMPRRVRRRKTTAAQALVADPVCVSPDRSKGGKPPGESEADQGTCPADEGVGP